MSDYNNMEIRCKKAERSLAVLEDELAQADAAIEAAAAALNRAEARIDALVRQLASAGVAP